MKRIADGKLGPSRMTSELDRIRAELHEVAEPARVTELRRFFKTGPGEYAEGDLFLGVRVPSLRAAARRHAKLDLGLSLELLQSPIHEERLLALLIWVARHRRGDAQERQRIFELYLANTRHVNGWDLVDASAPGIVGAQLLTEPTAARGLLDRLCASSLVWDRRIAVLATFAFIREGNLDLTLRLARRLLEDEHSLIHKAVGWMLRELGKRDRARLLGFLEEHGAVMPRTMLRYAIEHLDAPLRAHLMALGPGRTAQRKR